MKYALFYETAPGGLEKTPLHGAAHRAHWASFVEDGTLLLVGPFMDGSGALAVFTTRDAAEAFAKNDPFVLHGVVGGYTIREWAEAIGS